MMKLSLVHSIVALALAASPVHANLRGLAEPPQRHVWDDKCFTNMTEIYEITRDDSLLNVPKRFVICPGTTVNLARLVPGEGFTDGQSPIIPRSNTEYLCGEDGASKNNCKLVGGDFGVIAVPVFFRQDTQVKNVKIKGFTFKGQKQYHSFSAYPGDITFEDCIFKVSEVLLSLLFFHSLPLSPLFILFTILLGLFSFWIFGLQL